MKETKLKLGSINCRTQEEREMVLDIFEMIGYRWNAGQEPRGYHCRRDIPMSFSINNVRTGKITEDCVRDLRAIEAKNLRNMWISLKRRKNNEVK